MDGVLLNGSSRYLLKKMKESGRIYGIYIVRFGTDIQFWGFYKRKVCFKFSGASQTTDKMVIVMLVKIR